MGTSRSAAELALKLRHAGEAIPKAASDGVFKAAMLVKGSVTASFAAAGLKGGRMRGVGAKGAKVSVGFDMKPGAHPTALVRMKGPAHLLESDTRAHEIGPKRKQAISIPGQGAFASAQHPGTRGKHPWARGVDAAIPKVRTVMATEQIHSLRRFFS